MKVGDRYWFNNGTLTKINSTWNCIPSLSTDRAKKWKKGASCHTRWASDALRLGLTKSRSKQISFVGLVIALGDRVSDLKDDIE